VSIKNRLKKTIILNLLHFRFSNTEGLQHPHQQDPQNLNFPFVQPQMPFISQSPASSPPVSSTTSQVPEAQAQAAPPQVAQPQQPAEPQRRFPNIIQDEQENHDWLDILYSMSRLLILLCLVYFYSSPLRCLIVIIIGVSLYW
jgi:hypothetical protein